MHFRLPCITILLLQVLSGACGGSVSADGEIPRGGGIVYHGDAGEDGDTPAEGEFSLKVATANLLKPGNRRTEMSLDNAMVREALGRSIIGTGASLLAFNEVDEDFIPWGKYAIDDICGELPDSWRWKLAWPNDIHQLLPVTYSYANGYAYDSEVLTEEACGYVWLAKESKEWFTEPSKAYLKAGSPERTCVWVRFRHRSSGEQFYFFVSHLPTESQGGGEMMAGNLNAFAASKAGDLPMILAGDMNSAPSNSNRAPYMALTSFWKDGNMSGRGTQSGSSDNYYYTVEVFTNNHPERRIDHILTHGCTASGYGTIIETYSMAGKLWCPSDHLPLACTVTF